MTDIADFKLFLALWNRAQGQETPRLHFAMAHWLESAFVAGEVASDDAYVRRMRPTFGYLMAATWAAQMFGVAYIMVFRTDQAGVVLNAVESLSMIWTVGLSVLGVYVYKRSEDKRLGL